VSAAVESARREWEDGHRRFRALVREDPRRAARLHAVLDAMTAELRRRIGLTFTLSELAAAYADAERWSRDVVAEHAPGPGWTGTVAVVEDAAFHLYQRGAVDFRP
jgi:hypothetical protein